MTSQCKNIYRTRGWRLDVATNLASAKVTEFENKTISQIHKYQIKQGEMKIHIAPHRQNKRNVIFNGNAKFHIANEIDSILVLMIINSTHVQIDIKVDLNVIEYRIVLFKK